MGFLKNVHIICGSVNKQFAYTSVKFRTVTHQHVKLICNKSVTSLRRVGPDIKGELAGLKEELYKALEKVERYAIIDI